MLPSAAAAALVVTATGATVAESAPAVFDLAGSAARAKAANAAAAEFNRVETEQQREVQASAAEARVTQAQRIARDAERRGIAKKQAAAAAVRKAEAARKARERWVPAIAGAAFTSGFGWRWGKTHDGIDLGATTGTPIYAMSRGEVIGSYFDSSFGNKVEIRYWDGSISWYGHLSKRIAQKGDTVMPGELVGLVGNTGHSFGSHLHLEFQQTVAKDTPIDPMPWLRKHGLI